MTRAIITCVNYADILTHTLPYFMQYLDKIIVVTSRNDEDTKNCTANRSHKVTLVQTDKFYDDGAKFNKGKGINVGLEYLLSSDGTEDWILISDADMALTSGIDTSALDKEFLYGTRRLTCPNYEEWVKYRRDLPVAWQYQNDSDKWNTGRAGYFQLFHPTASSLGTMPWYPEDSPNAGKSDYRFWRKFKDNEKVRTMPKDPGMIELHPDFHGTQQGANWEGRKTPMFGAPIQPVNNEEPNPNILGMFQKEKKMATIKELDCPLRFGSQDSKCLGSKCAWMRGDENKPMNTDGAGLCAVSDVAGWLGSLHKLASGGKK